MMRFLLFSICLHLVANEPYEFAGKHFIASYLDCDAEALSNVDGLMKAMDDAIVACGATVLDKSYHVFPPNGLTVVYLLSESHASIHTYPEHGACFIDLFTCGNKPSAKIFDETLHAYLHPKQEAARYFLRQETIEELPYTANMSCR